MRTDLSDHLRGVLDPVVTGVGLYLESVDVAGPPRRRVVRVTVDLPDGPGGVGSDRLSEVSHQVSTALDDVDDVLEGAYLLEVSTPGVERPLTDARHFRRAEGRLVTVQTPDGPVTGRVRAVDADAVRLELQDRRRGTTTTRTVPWAGISSAHVEVELRRSSDDD